MPTRLAVVACLASALAGCVPTRPEDAAFRDDPVKVSDRVSYVLEDGELSHMKHPATFEIPPLMRRHNLRPDEIVKLMFTITTPKITTTERMWVIVRARVGEGYVGTLDNDPVTTGEMRHGMEVRFEPRHVIQIHPGGPVAGLPAAK